MIQKTSGEKIDGRAMNFFNANRGGLPTAITRQEQKAEVSRVTVPISSKNLKEKTTG
jgi:hypothetical protein